ncbi:12154_t:CDS:1, partial [Racocetra persica]
YCHTDDNINNGDFTNTCCRFHVTKYATNIDKSQKPTNIVTSMITSTMVTSPKP